MPDVNQLNELARQMRYDVLDMTGRWGGHPSSCFSAVEIMTALYFGGVVRYRPDDPSWAERDRVILSKGHAAPLLYSALVHAGYAPVEELQRFRQRGSGLHGHPIQGTFPGVEMTSGSLGQGLSFGLGHVLAGRLGGLDYRVFVVMGDGECEEGQVWEAAMAAAHYRAGRLIAIVDHNKYQQTGPISREMSLAPLANKWREFGWNVAEVDGHDVGAVIEVLQEVAPALTPNPSPVSTPQVLTGPGAGLVRGGKPSVVIAHTVKGKGVSFMEADYTFHGRALTPEQDARARAEIAKMDAGRPAAGDDGLSSMVDSHSSEYA
jgi:transketolase